MSMYPGSVMLMCLKVQMSTTIGGAGSVKQVFKLGEARITRFGGRCGGSGGRWCLGHDNGSSLFQKSL